jgi:hypothetical protein
LYAGFGQPVDLIQHGLAGGPRCRNGRLEGQRRQGFEGCRADGNSGDAPQRIGQAGVVHQLGKHRSRARRKERRGIERVRFKRGPRRLRQYCFLAGVVEREAMNLETVGGEGLREIEREVDPRDMDQRALFGIEAAPDQRRQGSTIARRRNDGGESQALGRRGGGVADREDRLCALLARFGERPCAIGTGQQHGLAGRKCGGKLGRRTQELEPEQRRDDRRVAATDQCRRQRRCLAFRPDDQHAHALSVAGASR